jgi:hypothetical protein
MTGFSAHGVRDLKLKVAAHLRELASEALDNDNVDLGLAARIADALWSMVDEAHDRSVADQSAVRGAVDYFVLNRDEVSDLEPGGFVDDAEVVNQVARDLGLHALLIRIPDRARASAPAAVPIADTP